MTQLARIQWQSPHLFWLTVLALAAIMSAIVWLYRPQVKPLRAPWWWILLGLRAFALGILALSILRPTVLRAVKIDQRPMIAVLVDQSASMSVVDAARSPAQLVQLAAAIGDVTQEQRPPLLAELRRRCLELRQTVDEISRAGSELEYARLAGRGVEAAEAHLHGMRKSFAEHVGGIMSTASANPATAPLADVLAPLAPNNVLDHPEVAVERIEQTVTRIDDMQQAADTQLYQTDKVVHDACDRLAGLPRIELVKRAMLSDAGGIVPRLGADRPLRFFGFSHDLGVLQLPLDDLRADGAHSDLPAALREARRRLAGQRVAGAVVFTDGRQTEPSLQDLVAPAEAPPVWPEVPVFAVVAAPASTRDVAISRVSLPSSGFVGETINVRIELSALGFDSGAAEVSLQAAGQAQQSVQVPIAASSGKVELPLRLEQPGLLEVTIRVAPQSGEATDRNNTVRRSIKVISEKIRVALIGGAATRDYQHLRSALLRSPRFTLMDRLNDSGSAATIRPEEILEQDAVILCELPVDALDDAQWDAIDRLVNSEGGSLLMILGDPAIAAAYASEPLTASLLPWRGGMQPASRVWPGEDPMFRIVPAIPEIPELIKLSDDPDLSRQQWDEMPGIYRFLAMPPLKPGSRPLLIDRDSASPVLVESSSGAGRVLFLGTDEIWRWRGNATGSGSAANQREPNRFWRQLVRFTAQQPYTAHDGNLWLDLERPQIEPGEIARVRARVRVGGGDVEADQPVVAPVIHVVRADSSVINIEQLNTPVGGSVDRYETSIPDLPAGEYKVRLLSGDQQLSLPLRVVETEEAEMRDVSPDPVSLRRIVGTRGDVINIEELQTLPQRLAESTRSEPAYTELRLWDSPYLFLLVLGCLGVEWAVRKRVGLA